MEQPSGTTVGSANYTSAGTYSISFTLPVGTIVRFSISGSAAVIPINYYVDNVTMTYAGMVTAQEYVDNYRYGFNGMEKDNEIKGTGNSYDFGARIYDSRLGRWTSVDPAFAKQPSQSTYQALHNNPLIYVDPDGNTEYLTVTIINRATGQKSVKQYEISDKYQKAWSSETPSGDAAYDYDIRFYNGYHLQVKEEHNRVV